MPLTRIEEAILAAAYFRGREPSENVWASNSDQVLTLSLFYTEDISFEDCASRFEQRPHLRRTYDDDGQLNEQIRHRYEVLLDLIQRRPDLIEGGGNLTDPADPSYTACGLTDAGCQMARALLPSFPQKPEFPNWPDRRANQDLLWYTMTLTTTIYDQYGSRERPSAAVSHGDPLEATPWSCPWSG